MRNREVPGNGDDFRAVMKVMDEIAAFQMSQARQVSSSSESIEYNSILQVGQLCRWTLYSICLPLQAVLYAHLDSSGSPSVLCVPLIALFPPRLQANESRA